jgi:Transmembrane secretion effector
VALLAAALGIVSTILLQSFVPLPSAKVDLSPWNQWVKPGMFEHFDGDAGPVLVTVRYVIEPARSADFLQAMYRYQRIRRRDGATRWGIFYDTEAKNVYLETFLVDSWAEHERQHERFTVADRAVEEELLKYTLETPVATHYIHAERE